MDCYVQVWFLGFLFCSGLTVGELTDTVPYCQQNNTDVSCCPCYQEEACTSTNITCPSDYLMVLQEDQCQTRSRTTAVTMATTSPPKNSSTVADISADTTDIDDGKINERIVCVKSCPENEHYDNTSLRCMKCSAECQSCNLFDLTICSVCKFEYKGNCYAQCPEGTEIFNKTENGTGVCVPSNGEKTLPIAAIAGGAAGGLVVLIVVIIIIVCSCRRHNKPVQRRPISVLAEQRGASANSSDIEAPKDNSLSRPRNYENTGATLRPSTDAIQQQGDQIFRYAKDPTTKDKKAEEEDSSNRDSLYGNEAMIRLVQKTDMRKIDSTELQERLELEELGQAPLPAGEAEEEPGDYLPMTGTEIDAGPAAPFGRPRGAKSAMLPHVTGSRTRAASPGRTKLVDDGKTSKQPPPVKSKPVRTTAKSSAPSNTDALSGLEDYENVDSVSIPAGRQGNKKEMTQRIQESKLEDYENFSTSGLPTQLSPKKSGPDLEDYENTEIYKKSIAAATAGMAVDDNDQEDYENVKDMNNLPLYENTEFSTGKKTN